ncbi:unnamed protein product [Effrenium voratum]|uniref:Cyclic nucleotide-binding domain-containing protein n=1 Tax=Effrenium voratum TaxID=2562239 RepID=A0AA36I9H0_9DINO|nr:unnamed protein product [Effrenium voratum]CAJ1436339.1 unnamed protein product [Effrenium voratum]
MTPEDAEIIPIQEPENRHSPALPGVPGLLQEPPPLLLDDSTPEGVEVHNVWGKESGEKSFQELVGQLETLQSQLVEAHERELQEAYEASCHRSKEPDTSSRGSISPGLRLAPLVTRLLSHRRGASRASEPCIPTIGEVHAHDMGLPTKMRKRRSPSAALSRVELVMRAARSFEEQIRKETDLEEVDKFSIRPMFDLSDNELVELKRRCITKPSSELPLHEDERHGTKSSVELAAAEDNAWKCKNMFPVHPSSSARILWDFCAMLFLAYDLVTIPMQVFDVPKSTLLSTLAMLCSIYWTLDIVACMSTAIYINGKLVRDRSMILQQYARTWMSFDIFLVLTDWITTAIGNSAAESLSLARTLRSGRVVRMLRFARLFRVIKLKRLVDDVRHRASTEFAIFVINVTQLFVSTALLTHVLACLWYMLGSTSDEGWVYTEGLAGTDLGTTYVMSMQWSLSRLHPISLRDNMKLKLPEERMFSLLASFGSLLFSSLFISYVTNTMARLARMWKERSLKLTAIGEYAVNHRIKTALTVRLKKYVEREEERKRFTANLEVLQTALPAELLRILFSAARSPTLMHHGFFMQMKRQHPHVIVDICVDAVSEMHLLAGDTVFEPGRQGFRMYLCDAGKLAYSMDNDMVHEAGTLHLHAEKRGCCPRSQVTPTDFPGKDMVELPVGCFLSEAALWTSSWLHAGHLSAVTDSQVFAIKAEEFGRCIQRDSTVLCDVVIYARYFVQEMNTNLVNSDLPSDHIKREGSKDLNQAQKFFKMHPAPSNLS